MSGPHSGLALLRAVPLVAALTLTQAQGQPSLEGRAAEPIFGQLEAFRRNDYDAAYALASAEIRRLFDRGAFERMVRRGYPEIAESRGGTWKINGVVARPDPGEEA